MNKSKNNPDLIVIFDNIRSTYNVGAIFRKESLNMAVAFGIAVYQIRNLLYN